MNWLFKKLYSPHIVITGCFVLFIILLLPVLSFKFFPTVDGPAHLYNARIIRELLFGEQEFYSNYFHFNNVPVPNWTGHFIAVLTGLFLPVWAVEKLILLLIIIGLPLSVISFCRSISGVALQWHILLLLPFTYTIILYLGFFNFLISLSLFFFTSALIIKWSENLNIKKFVILTLLTTAIYFSHIFSFVLLIFFSVLFIFSNSLKSKVIFSNNFLKQISIFIPGIILAIIFFYGKGIEGYQDKVDILSNSQLITWFVEAAPLTGLNGNVETIYSQIFLAGLIILSSFVGLIRINSKNGFYNGDLLLLMSVIMLVSYFIIPNGFASGGFVSLRLLMLFMLFLTAWLLTHKLPLFLSVLAGMLAILSCYPTLPYRYKSASALNKDVFNLQQLTPYIKKNSILLPLNYSQNWLHINLSNYLGAEKQVIVLDNYETVLKEFPLIWNESKNPYLKAGNFTSSRNPYIDIENYESKSKTSIKYISRWNYKNTIKDTVSIKTSLDIVQHYRQQFENDDAELFERK